MNILYSKRSFLKYGFTGLLALIFAPLKLLPGIKQKVAPSIVTIPNISDTVILPAAPLEPQHFFVEWLSREEFEKRFPYVDRDDYFLFKPTKVSRGLKS